MFWKFRKKSYAKYVQMFVDSFSAKAQNLNHPKILIIFFAPDPHRFTSVLEAL